MFGWFKPPVYNTFNNCTFHCGKCGPVLTPVPTPKSLTLGKGESFMKIAFPCTVPPAVVKPGEVPPARTVLVVKLDTGERLEKTYDGNGVTDQFTRGVPVGSNGAITSYFEDASGNKSPELDPPVTFTDAQDKTPPSAPGALTMGLGQEVADDQ